MNIPIDAHRPEVGSPADMVLLAALERYPRTSEIQHLQKQVAHYQRMTPEDYRTHRAGIVLRLTPSVN